MSWQTGPRLLEAVASILATPDVDEFVLVNHGNPPEMIRKLRRMAADSDRLVLVETGANLGFAKGCNIGAQRADGDWVLFLNPDAVLQPGALKRLKASAAELGDRMWVLGARITNENGTEQRGGRRGELTPVSAMVTCASELSAQISHSACAARCGGPRDGTCSHSTRDAMAPALAI